MPSKPVRWGILGAGKIAHKFATALRDVTGAELVAVGSLSGAELFARAHDVARVHASYEALAADPDVDVIYVATPHSRHCEDSLTCLAAGKHVLCEKPIATSEIEAQRMVDAARRANVFLMEAMWMRFIPLIREIEWRVRDGAIGEVRLIEASFGFRSEIDPKSRLYDARLGGGSLLDVGVYPLAFATLFLGEPVEVVGLPSVGQTGIDEQAGMVCRFDTGALAVLSSAIRTDTSRAAHIFGTDGEIDVPAPFWRGQRATLRSGGRSEDIVAPYAGNGYQFEAQHVVDCLAAGKVESDVMPVSASLGMMRTLDRLRSSWPHDEKREP